MSNPIATFIGWSLVPSLATRFIQSAYYGIMIRAGDPKPRPGTPIFAKHHKRIQITLIIAYLFYTFYEASLGVRDKGNFYQVLGVSHDAEERTIKSKFRRMAAIYHPDKVGASADGAPSDDSYFVLLKTAQDTLIKPAQRFAYDRFGPAMLTWEHCSSKRDYLGAGLKAAWPQYAGSGLMLIILGATGYLPWGRFWRYYLLGCLILLEVYVTTRPYAPGFLTQFINPILTTVSSQPPLLPFQALVLARSFTFTCMMALSQLGSHLQTKSTGASPNEVDASKLAQLEKLAKLNEVEASRLLELDMMPYRGEGKSLRELRDGLKEWLVQNTIYSDPEVKEAVGQAIIQRNT